MTTIMMLISDTVLSGDAHVWAMNVISEHVGESIDTSYIGIYGESLAYECQ